MAVGGWRTMFDLNSRFWHFWGGFVSSSTTPSIITITMTVMEQQSESESDLLHSFNTLYALLHTPTPTLSSISNSNPNPNPNPNSNPNPLLPLDDRARLLLKNLLDAAASNEIITPTHVNQSPTNAEFRQEVVGGDNKDRIMSNESAAAEQNQPDKMIDQPSDEPEYRAKRCRVCQRNTIKTKNGSRFYHSNSFSGPFVSNTNLNTALPQQFNERDESKTQKQHGPFERNLSFIERRRRHLPSDFSVPHWSRNKAEQSQQEVDVLSKEVEQIESGISAFHLGADVPKTKSDEPAAQNECSAVPSLYMSKGEERYICRDNRQYGFSSQRGVDQSVGQELHQAAAQEEMYPAYLLSKQTSNLAQPTRAMWEQAMGNSIAGRGPELPNNIQIQNIKGKFESGNWMTGNNNELVQSQIHDMQNAAIPLNPNETFYVCSTYPTTYPCIEDNGTHRWPLFQTYTPTAGVMGLNEGENTQFVEPNPTFRAYPSKMIFADHHFDKKLPQPYPGFYQSQRSTGVPCKDGILHYSKYTTEKPVLQRRDTDGSSRSYTSNSESEQTSESGEYSLLDYSRGAEYTDSRTNSETETGSFYSDDPSCYSSTCSAAPEESSRSSSTTEESSSRDQPINYRAGIKSGLGRTIKSSNCKNCKRKRGTWRQLKDKLAIIFHHHHHHHHHHNYDDNDNDRRWDSLQKQREKEAKAERAIAKTRKPLILQKDQQSYLRGLMKGFFRHVRPSDKSQQRKETADQIFKGQQNGWKKNAFEKPIFFQLPQQHKGAKLSSKNHPNHGFSKTKPI